MHNTLDHEPVSLNRTLPPELFVKVEVPSRKPRTLLQAQAQPTSYTLVLGLRVSVYDSGV